MLKYFLILIFFTLLSNTQASNKEKIIEECQSLLNDVHRFERMSELHNPYGDGQACKRVVKHIKNL